MKFKLSQILDSNLLLEGRKEDAIRKYGEEHTELINLLSDADPSGNNKYLGWMVKASLGMLSSSDIPLADTVARRVTDFHNQLSRIKNKDINSYKDWGEFIKVVDEALSKAEEKRISKEAVKVYEDDDVVIMAPMTVEASCKYGAGSKWCIAATSGPDGVNQEFDNYSKHSNFYFFIRKNVSAKNDPVGYKYALQFRFTNGENLTWWNAQDNSSSNAPSFVTTKMMDAVRAYNPSHIKKKLQAHLNSFLAKPKLSDYKKYSTILTDEQRVGVVNKIISLGQLTSKHFIILAPDLSEKQKNNFINQYTKGSITASDYEKMKEHLTEQDKKAIIINNPTILNNFKIMSELNDVDFSDETKFFITKKLDSKLINNTDSKVLLKKWSMTKEEREKHNETSFYVYLSDSDIKSVDSLNLMDKVSGLVKVDPLDPNSYRTINMLKLKKQVQQEMKMYGIKTSFGLLDEYLSNDLKLPSNIADIIKEKSVEIG